MPHPSASLRTSLDPLYGAIASPPATAGRTTGPQPMRISVHRGPAAIEDTWRALQDRSDCTAFQTYDWIAAWQRHIGAPNGTLPAIALGEAAADGRPLFIFALAIDKQAGLNRLTWLGSDLCDYNGPILDRAFAASLDETRFRSLWQDVLAQVSADTGLHLDYIDLARMPATIGAVRNPFLALHPDRHPSGAYAATLFGDWDTFYAAKRSASTRKTVRKQLKQLARRGEPAFVLVEGAADRRATLDVLMAQKAQSLARMGVENFFEQPGYRDFFRDVIGNPALGGLVHISRLDAGAATAATGMGLTFGGSFYLILASYDCELSAHGPGRAHLHEMLRHFIGEGYGRFDFTVGDEAYKRDWSDEVIDLHDYLAPVSLRGFARVSATRLFRRSKRLIKQTPALWRMFTRLRARFGGGSTPAGHRDDAG